MDEKFSMCRTVYKYRQEYFHNIWPNNWKNRKSKRVYYKIRFIHLHYVRNERGTWSVKSFCWGEKCPIKPDSRNNITRITIDLRCSHCCIHHLDTSWFNPHHILVFVDIIFLGTSVLVPLVYGYLVLKFKLNRPVFEKE